MIPNEVSAYISTYINSWYAPSECQNNRKRSTMMIATIIPYFLVCNISVDPAWPNGPEYVFRVGGNVSAQWDYKSSAKVAAYEIALRCRPKDARTLSCITKNATASMEGYGTQRNHDFLGLHRFDMEFNEIGAENITIPFSTDIIGESFVRHLASQFTVGTDLSGKTDQDGVFQVMNSTVEPRKMDVAIRYTSDTEYKEKNNLYQLEVLPQINKPIGKAIEITKDKIVNVDGTYQTIEIPFLPPDNNTITIFQRTDRMNDRMKISKHSFESSTHEKGLISWIEMGYKVIYEGFLKIKLMDVVPADEPFPDVVRPRTFSVLEPDDITKYFSL